MRLHAAAATQKGPGRERNEDVYVLQLADGLFVVCDGMGGTAAGEVASQMAAATILRELRAPDTGSSRGSLNFTCPQSSRLAEAVRESNRLIHREAQQNPHRCEMGTTVVSAWLQRSLATVASVGDSRAYLWRDNHLEMLTRDHTLLEVLLREGLELTDGELDEDPRDILVRVVGGEPEVEVDVVEVPVRSGDYLVLCTDGLTRIVADAAVSTTISRLRDPEHVCKDLVHSAMSSGGTDDVTVLIVEIVDTEAL
jgi:protein phosphatase